MEKIITVKEMRKEYPIGSSWNYYEGAIRHKVKVLNIYRKKESIKFKLEALTECQPFTSVGDVFLVSFNQSIGMGGYCPWYIDKIPSRMLLEG